MRRREMHAENLHTSNLRKPCLPRLSLTFPSAVCLHGPRGVAHPRPHPRLLCLLAAAGGCGRQRRCCLVRRAAARWAHAPGAALLPLSCESNTQWRDRVRASSAALWGLCRRSQPRWVAAAKDDTSGQEEAELVQMDAVRVRSCLPLFA